VPLSFAQEQLWFVDRLQPGNTAYNIHAPARLTGRLDIAALEKSVGEIIRRHEILRTTFADVDEGPVQIIAPFVGFTLPVEDLVHGEGTPTETEAWRRANELAQRPFDLRSGPLIRATLLRLASEDHLLLVSMHHIVGDAWSVVVLYRELSALYESYRAKGDASLPTLPLQYADYAMRHRAQLREGSVAAQLSYWRAHLAGAPPLLAFPTDRPRPAAQTSDGALERAVWSPRLLEQLQAAGRSEGATLYMVLLAAFQIVLGKYADTVDVIVGSPITGRTCPEVERLIGLFVNTLVLRTDLSGDPSLREVLRRVYRTTLNAYEHPDVPFDMLVNDLRPQRSLSHSPLIQVTFALHNGNALPKTLSDVTVERVSFERPAVRYDLSLFATPSKEGLVGGIAYRTELFDRRSIERLLAHYTKVLEQIATNLDTRLSNIDLLDADEWSQVVYACNRTNRDVALEFVHRQFEIQAARVPDAVAVVCEDAALSYGELNTAADRLAARLLRLGVEPEVCVAIHAEPGPSLVVAVLAVLKAGGAYVVLDHGVSRHLLTEILADSRARVLVTDTTPISAVPGDVPVVRVDQTTSVDGGVATSAHGATLGNLAFVQYASEGTAQKGTAVSHAALANYLAWARETHPVGRSVVHDGLALGSLVVALFVSLVSGGCVEIVRQSTEGLARRLRHGSRVDVLKLAPKHLRTLGGLLHRWGTSYGPECLVLVGDAVVGEQLDLWRQLRPEITINNEYGSSETVESCCAFIRPLRDVGPGRIPVGRAVSNTQLYVLDQFGVPVPSGVPGELYVGGAQLARGYLNKQALTADRFVPDAFGTTPGQRLYRTADRVVRRPGGSLKYIGRLTERVTIRGFRVEPSDTAMEIQRHGLDCVVVAREDTAGDKRLVAYLRGKTDEDTLREHLQSRLPEHMVPAHFVSLERLPSPAHAQSDGPQLPVSSDGAKMAGRPRKLLEEHVANVWRSVLPAADIAVDDNFFDIGGTSLLLYRVYTQLRTVRTDLRIVDLFRYTTIEALARYLETPAPPAIAQEARHASAETLLAETRARVANRRAARKRTIH